MVQRLLAALELAVRVLGTMPGRRILILNSSGFLSSSQGNDLDRIIDNALYHGVVVNALSAKGLEAEIPGGKASEQRLDGGLSVSPANSRYETQEVFARMDAENAAMTNLSDSTGGKFFKNSNDFLQSLNDLMVNEGVYSLSFSPHPLKRDGKFHKLTVRVKQKDANVYARKGYFALAGKELATAKGATDRSLPAPPLASAESKLPAIVAQEPPKPAANEKGVPAKSAADGPVAATGVAPDAISKAANAKPAIDLPLDGEFLTALRSKYRDILRPLLI